MQNWFLSKETECGTFCKSLQEAVFSPKTTEVVSTSCICGLKLSGMDAYRSQTVMEKLPLLHWCLILVVLAGQVVQVRFRSVCLSIVCMSLLASVDSFPIFRSQPHLICSFRHVCLSAYSTTVQLCAVDKRIFVVFEKRCWGRKCRMCTRSCKILH